MAELRMWHAGLRVWRGAGLSDIGPGVVTPPPVNQAPGAPGGLAAVSDSSSTALTWLAATDPDGTVASYRVTMDGVQVASVTGLSCTVTGLAASTTHTFGVTAVDNAGATGPTVTATSTTSATAPPSDITHGFQITAANTGHTAYLDPSLGRYVVDGDLVVHTSPVSLSDFVANGGTVAKHWFKGGLNIDRTGVTIRACRFDSMVSGYYAGVHNPFALEWCTVAPPSAVGDESIHYQDFTAYRCRLGGNSDGAKTNGNVAVTECFIRVAGQSSLDHNDGLQNVGGSGPVTVVRCNIDATPTNGIGGPNAAIMAADGCTGLQTWTDNFVAGGGYTLRLYENATYDVQGNWVLDGSWTFGPVARAVIPASNVTWGTVRENRVVSTAGSTVSVLSAP